jgi:lambda repressor-like predicted transcriptional regulator
MPISKSKSPADHLSILKDKGWSLRTAAPHLGVHFGHLHQVLQGRRESQRLLRAIQQLPARHLSSAAIRRKGNPSVKSS